MRQKLKLAAMLVIVWTGTAFAQSAYVGVDLVGDVLRSTHSESSLGLDVPSGGEAIGFGLRIGTPLGSHWGIELAFTRPGEIETEFSGAIPLASSAEILTTIARAAGNLTATQLFPSPLPYRLRATQRHSTLSTTVWFNQTLSSKVSLVYLGGMGFYRNTYESESRFDILPAGIISPIVFPSLTKTVTYGVRPLAGFEARVHLTDHVDLVPWYPAARARERVAAASRRRPRVELLTTKATKIAKNTKKGRYSQVWLTGDIPRTFRPSRPPSPISVARTDIR
jgi:hypothetical protein